MYANKHSSDGSWVSGWCLERPPYWLVFCFSWRSLGVNPCAGWHWIEKTKENGVNTANTHTQLVLRAQTQKRLQIGYDIRPPIHSSLIINQRFRGNWGMHPALGGVLAWDASVEGVLLDLKVSRWWGYWTAELPNMFAIPFAIFSIHYQTPDKKQENCSRLEFIIENGCVLH